MDYYCLHSIIACETSGIASEIVSKLVLIKSIGTFTEASLLSPRQGRFHHAAGILTG